MIFGCEENGSDCAHTPAPDCQPLHLEVLIGLSEDCLRVCRLVESVGEEAGIAIAASHEVERNHGYSMLGNEGKHSQYLDLTASVAVEVQESILDCPMLLAEDDCADVAAVISGDCEV
jgi:hypothetical protein